MSKPVLPVVWAIALVVFHASAASGQVNTFRPPEVVRPIITDRPDITESPQVVGKGRFQIETGLLNERSSDRFSSERLWITPTLFRFGFDPRWEARVETDGFSHLRTSTRGGGVQRTSGYSPVAVGVKYNISDPPEGSRRPALGVITHVDLPSGSSVFDQDKVTGNARLLAAWDLTDRLSFSSNTGILLEVDDAGEVFPSALLTGSLGYSLSDRWGVFAELAFQGPEADGTSRSGLIFDGGFTYLLNNDTQLDLALGTGLAGRTTPDWYWTVGFSRRFR